MHKISLSYQNLGKQVRRAQSMELTGIFSPIIYSLNTSFVIASTAGLVITTSLISTSRCLVISFPVECMRRLLFLMVSLKMSPIFSLKQSMVIPAPKARLSLPLHIFSPYSLCQALGISNT